MTAPTSTTRHAAAIDVERVREDFPILAQTVEGQPLIYLDNAATTQKPHAVIDAISDYYRTTNANIHRGIHHLSEKATDAYEAARARIARFVNAPATSDIVFTRGTTESINLVAQAWGRTNLKDGDEILLTHMEHHSNIVPWQMLCEQTGSVIKVAPIDDRGQLMFDQWQALLTDRTKLVAFNHVSNALGTINPAKRMIEAAHAAGAIALVDGAQAAPHLPIDVQALDCDFYAFSGHKLYGPTGIGVLYGKQSLLETMDPYQGGGEMILNVTFEKSVYQQPPHRFEAGTPNIVGPIGLAAAIDYVDSLGLDAVAAHEDKLLRYGTAALQAVDGLRLIGTADHKAGVLSFVLDFAHPLDAGTIMDRYGVAVRTGHHCAQPVMDRFGIPATLRASLAVYNTKQEIDALVESIEKVRKFL
jgi:cysteine desulfurase/selenocysteine lyase